METTLDKFGRVVIPKEIRDDLGLKPGEVMQIEISDKEVILKPLRTESPLYVKEGILVYSGVATGDILETIRIHRDERIKKAASIRKK